MKWKKNSRFLITQCGVNAIVHIVPALITRRYNPGLGTALVMFLPLSIYTLREVQLTGAGDAFHHATGLIIAIGMHAAIVAYAKRGVS